MDEKLTTPPQAPTQRSHIVRIPEGKPGGGQYVIWTEGSTATSPFLSREGVRQHIVMSAVASVLNQVDHILLAADAVAMGLAEGMTYDRLEKALAEVAPPEPKITITPCKADA